MTDVSILAGAIAALGLAGAVQAQGLSPLVPFESVADAYAVDSTADKLYGFADLNLDGDFGDLDEAWVFYDDAIGPLVLTNPSGLAVGNGARFYVADRSTGQVLRFVDLDGDRTAHDPGEAVVVFDGDPLINLSGLTVDQPVRLIVDGSEVVWVAESNASGAGKDAVLRLQDLNFDGDANDFGEAVRYFEPDPGLVAGDTMVVDVLIADDGFLYYVEGSSTGFRSQGLYRLDDANADGVIDPLLEVAQFFTVPPMPNPTFLQAGAIDGQGRFLLADTGNDVVWRLADLNADGDADDPGEATIYFTAPPTSLYWDVSPLADGRAIVCGSDGLGELILLDDVNNNGTIDVGEAVNVYTAPSGTVLPNPRSIVWELRPMLDLPATASVGGVGAGLLFAGSSDLCVVYYSLATIAPLFIAPYGVVLIDPNPAAGFRKHMMGTASIGGSLPVAFTVPSSPGLAGLSVYWQAVAGKADRLLLSNLQTLLIL